TPALFTGDWNVSGISVVFDQAFRSLNSTYSLSFRNKNTGEAGWSDWVDFPLNLDDVANANPTFNSIRQVLPHATDKDSVQIKVTYLAHYYFWMIDDFKIIETECTNTRVQSNFFAIAPFAKIPRDQVYPFAALSDIYNAGSCTQTNVSLNLTVRNISSNEVVYDENLGYGAVESDSLAQNKLFPSLINLPKKDADYLGTYHLTQDSIDYNPTDNTISFPFSVGGDTFALETGFTRSIAVNNALYTVGAPLSYAYGNIFMPVVDAQVGHISWGVSNATAMAGKTVSIYLIEWTDTNGDHIAESEERTFIGYKDYTFTGLEGNNAILDTELENFEDPQAAVIMKGGKIYMAVVEYAAALSTDPQFFMLASDDHNYSAQELAMDSAVAHGLAPRPLYFTVLGFSPDGNIANIDYEVKELNVNDSRIFFGNNIVPLIRVVIEHPDNTVDNLSSDNIISVYPNPVSDVIRVKMEFKKAYQDVQLRLVNNLGQTVLRKTLKTSFTDHIEPIDLSGIAVGNYLLQVETADGQRSLPVIVVR
ncbi:MAG: T9SS type A sorting domain-containing protein, partial [Saprospiraceae bacterium]